MPRSSPNTEEPETSVLPELPGHQAHLICELKVKKKFCYKKQDECLLKNTQVWPLSYTRMHTHICIHTHTGQQEPQFM